MVEVPPDTLTVTMFCPYCAPTLRLQLGGLHVAVMMVVPPVLAVTVSPLGGAVVVPVLVVAATDATPAGTELHVKVGVMLVPLVSRTSATNPCVPAGARLKVVFELFAS